MPRWHPPRLCAIAFCWRSYLTVTVNVTFFVAFLYCGVAEAVIFAVMVYLPFFVFLATVILPVVLLILIFELPAERVYLILLPGALAVTAGVSGVCDAVE